MNLQKIMGGAQGNPWLACFTSRTFGLKGIIELMRIRGEMPPEDLERIDNKLQTVKNRKTEIQRQYGWDPPDEFRQELLAAFQAIIE